MPAIIASAMTPEPIVAIVDFARGDIARSIAARSARSGLGPGSASPCCSEQQTRGQPADTGTAPVRTGGRTDLVASRRHARQEEPARGGHPCVLETGGGQRDLELAGLVVDLDDRELAAVVE